MHLVSVYDMPDISVTVLYRLLQARPPETFISHRVMPTYQEHAAFVLSRPFFLWYLIAEVGAYVGAIEVTKMNEIGVAILPEFRRKGYGAEALRLFLDTHEPLPAIPAVRAGRWLANIAPGATDSKRFFIRQGFAKVQETYAHG